MVNWRTGDWPVAAVSEWGDDQPVSVAQVLVAVRHGGGDHAHNDGALLPVVTQLADPLEVLRATDARRV